MPTLLLLRNPAVESAYSCYMVGQNLPIVGAGFCWRSERQATGRSPWISAARPHARPKGIASYAAMRLQSDTLAFADQLGAKRFHLIAHDWGGLVAWGAHVVASESRDVTVRAGHASSTSLGSGASV